MDTMPRIVTSRGLDGEPAVTLASPTSQRAGRTRSPRSATQGVGVAIVLCQRRHGSMAMTGVLEVGLIHRWSSTTVAATDSDPSSLGEHPYSAW